VNPKGRKPFASNYTPANDPVNAYKAALQLAAYQEYKGEPLDCPLKVSILFVMLRPAGHYGTGKNEGKLKASAPCWHSTKSDVDNILKSTLDAMTGILWRDDCRVSMAMVEKRYVKQGEQPMVVIRVEKLDGNPLSSWYDELISQDKAW
jgi:Holliday junction resolvase RusA-like endonuclease